MMTLRPIAFAGLLLLALAPGARAQKYHHTSKAGWSVDRTMREFLNELPGDIRGYFPRRGHWDWVLTVEHPLRPPHRVVHRFPAAQTDSALAGRGPVCDSFNAGDFSVMGTVISHTGEDAVWRRVGARRFVPPGTRAGFPVFVEWRREDGRWVIAAFGEERDYVPRVLGRDPADVMWESGRMAPVRFPLPDTAQVAAGAEWYVNGEPIWLGRARMLKYGLPRQLNEGDVKLWATVHGVGVYMETRDRDRTPEVVYIPADRSGLFQPYMNNLGNGCAH